MSALTAFGQAAAGVLGGLHVTKSQNTLAAMRRKLLRTLSVSLVLDVGANVGQYARQLRQMGYSGRIISFEPLESAYRTLEKVSQDDDRHTCLQLAIGERESTEMMFVSENIVSSSLFPMMPLCVEAAPSTACTRTEKVSVRALDAVIPTVSTPYDKIWLKIDAQGYEAEVLAGASVTLDRIDAIEIELSTRPLYKGQAIMPDVWRQLHDNGFIVAWLERGMRDPRDNFVLQVDVLFVRATCKTVRSTSL